jgi:hypothetical protein
MEIPHLSRGPQAVGYLPFLQLPDMLRIQAPTLVLSRSNLTQVVASTERLERQPGWVAGDTLIGATPSTVGRRAQLARSAIGPR